MYTVDQALEQILIAFRTLPPETVALHDGGGRVLAAAVISEIDLPPFANSSMDGFAVRSADLTGEITELTVIGDIPAGVFPDFTVQAGQCARIMTGAPLPAGADSVVPVEQTDAGGLTATIPATIRVAQAVRAGDCVRPVGEDLRIGETVLSAGRVLRPADVGLLGSLGIARVSVLRRPKVALLSSGDELIEIDQPLTPGKIRNSNSIMLAAMLGETGADVLNLGIARDTEAAVEAKLNEAITEGADLILSSAGVSVGAFDVMRTVVERLGSLNFWKVNLRPGKPLAFGAVAGVPYIGLPGNPVSAFVTFDLFVRPAILKMSGKDWSTSDQEVITGEVITSDGRRTYARVLLERRNGLLVARQTGTQSSGALSSLVKADGLLIIPEGMTDIPVGTRLRVRVL